MIIIMQSTQLAENLGAVARVMGNFKLGELRLITPKVDPLDPKAVATAAGADDLLRSAKIYHTVSEATSDINTLFGTCADVRDGIRHYYTPEHAFESAPDESGSVGVLFGCEKSGLTQEDLSYCKATIQIPVNRDFSSMNLSHAVAIVAYAWFRGNESHGDRSMNLGKTSLASMAEKEVFFNHLETRLDDVGYWRVPGKKPLMKQNLANLFFRMDLTTQEIKTLLGMIDVLRKPRL